MMTTDEHCIVATGLNA